MATDNQEVYVMRMANAYKVGYSSSPLNRVKTLQTGCPAPIELIYRGFGTPNHEKVLHKMLDEWREHGEWFMLPDWIVSAIEQTPWRDDRKRLVDSLSMAMLFSRPEPPEEEYTRHPEGWQGVTPPVETEPEYDLRAFFDKHNISMLSPPE